MDKLHQHEIFQMELLNVLNSSRLLPKLIFGNGTMLRLCHELSRYSTDLDFYLKQDVDPAALETALARTFSQKYEITDRAMKLHTLLFELRSPRYPMRLKIEINVQRQISHSEPALAWSPYASVQVLVNVIPLADMLTMKIEACLDRREVRDLYDIEFILRKGLPLPAMPEEVYRLKQIIAAVTKNDINVKLGSLLDAPQRDYYRQYGFRFLTEKLK